MKDVKLVRRIRLMEYWGPADWIDSTMAHSFVKLDKVLGSNRMITSNWGPQRELTDSELAELQWLSAGISEVKE